MQFQSLSLGSWVRCCGSRALSSTLRTLRKRWEQENQLLGRTILRLGLFLSSQLTIRLRIVTDDLQCFLAVRMRPSRTSRSVVASNHPQPPSSKNDCNLVVVALVAVLCLAWTVWLMLLTIAPNETINYLMDTKAFDEGLFWRFINPQASALRLGLCGLGCVAFAYLYIIVRVTILRHLEFYGWSRLLSFQQPKKITIATIIVEGRPRTSKRARHSQIAPTSHTIRGAMTQSFDIAKANRPMLHVVLKFVDIGIQLYLLIDTMEKGLPVTIITIFTFVIVANALTTAVIVAGFSRSTGLPELLLDTIFDITIAVGLPVLVLLYCLTTFHVDRKLLAINLEIFRRGWFERGASINVDPVQPEIIRTSLNSLRIFSFASSLARVGSNCAVCRRLYQIAARIKDPVKRSRPIYPKHQPSAILLVVIALITFLFVKESIRTSTVACNPHPECIQHARRWVILRGNNSFKQCPCLTLIDAHPGVKTYDEWMNPPNVMKKVAQLATSGDLQMVSLVNRRLRTLPDELRGCENLRHLSLVYTDTEELPAWTKEFTRLEYFHIEGKYNLDNMVEMPHDLFEDMVSLTFLHIAVVHVSSVPSMKNLKNLKYLFLAQLLYLLELPSFEGLQSLEAVTLAVLPLVDSIPDTAPLINLKSFATLDRGSFCCNGFLGECNLNHSLCEQQVLFGSPPAVCLPLDRSTKIPSAATRETFVKFRMMACADQANKPGDLETGPTRETSDQCGGIMYRQCAPPVGGMGMCYSTRMMGISCGRNALAQEMRRRQISEGVGDRCNPVYEAWLGCKEKSL